MSSRSHDYYVYIVTNNTRSTIYIGVTNDLLVRVWQHRAGELPGGFSQRYHCAHLIHYEHYRENYEIDAELRARMEAHFKVCAHCKAVLDGTRNVVKLVGDGVEYQLPDGFSQRLYYRIKKA